MKCKCPWCQSENIRNTYNWTFSCFYCNKLFYVNKNGKSCKVVNNHGKWDYIDENKQSWMN